MKILFKKIFFYTSFVGILIFVLLWFGLLNNPISQDGTIQNHTKYLIPNQEDIANLTNTKNSSDFKTTPNEQLPFEIQFKNIVISIGQTTDHPEIADQELSSLASKLNLDQLNDLFQKVASKNTTGDEKLLATELIVRSSLPESIDLLKSIVKINPNENTLNSPISQQEFLAIQLIAAEGFIQKPQDKTTIVRALDELSQSSDNPIIIDRIQRTRAAIVGNAPSPVLQDTKALEKVLQTRVRR